MSSAREEILRKIRFAGGGASPSRDRDYDRIARDYRRSGDLPPRDVLELFKDRLHDYGCGVFHCPEAAITEVVAEVLDRHGKNCLLVPPDVRSEWLPDKIELIHDTALPYSELDRSEGVFTGCAVAIALTGTIVLSHAGQRRALTLIPDYHLCVVLESQVVETVPEAFAKLREVDPVLPITTISGPSATADIEMTRIKGVHGPRTLDVILAGPNASASHRGSTDAWL